MLITTAVYQKPHDYVALGTYAAEFTFWMGIFACGAYYRLFPWLCSESSTILRIQQRVSRRDTAAGSTRSTTDDAETYTATSGRALSGAVTEHEMEMEPQSMSVFRTASSRTSESLGQRNRVFHIADSAQASV